MKILAHRGYWGDKIVKNSPEAISLALKNGYGFESDVRDYMGQLVISHDVADEKAQKAEEVFRWLSEAKDQYCFAINIKADGLKSMLQELLQAYGITNYFVFDMSVPQMIEMRDMGLKYFTRQSEVEMTPVLYEDAFGVWIDAFWSDEWITEALLRKHIENGKMVCLVSPELHGNKDYKTFWGKLKGYQIDFDKVYLCTDNPDEAKEYFYE